jgi:Cu(I)/Ag(I) efflux system periplasmic protein CusF
MENLKFTRKTLMRSFAALGAALLTALPVQATELAEGEVRKVDKAAQKLTLRHGEIKNLDMPPMTMVFQVRDPSLLDRVRVGDKVRFAAEKSASGYLVIELQPAK